MSNERKYLCVTGRGFSQKISLSDILYMRQNMRDVKIVCNKFVVSFRGSVMEYDGRLNGEFYTCHSYLIVNLARIVLMCDGQVEFDDGRSVELGRNNFIHVRKAYDNFLKSMF